MKKFFKDVVGEIRNPSEDANKVLGVIRRAIRVAVVVTIVYYIAIFALNILMKSTSIHYALYYYTEGISVFEFLLLALTDIKNLLLIVVYIYLFFIISKSMKKNCKINKKLFVIMLSLLILVPFIIDLIKAYGFNSIILRS